MIQPISNAQPWVDILYGYGQRLIYFIESGDFIKVGYCKNNPRQRLSKLQVGNPERLNLLLTISGDRERETLLHSQFDRSHYRGEWFRKTDHLMSWISHFETIERNARKKFWREAALKSENLRITV